MVKHSVLVRGVDMKGTVHVRPVLLQMHDTDFPAHFLQDLADPRADPISSTIMVPSSQSAPAKLFQPVQRFVHLAMVQLNCNTLMFPPLATTRVESAGLVVRRVFRQRGDPTGPNSRAVDEVNSPPWAWMRSAKGTFDWVRLKCNEELQDPNPSNRPQLRSGSPDLDQRLAAMSLSAAMAEISTPAFVVPPDICRELGRTIVYGVVPTASSDVSDTPPAAPSYDRQELTNNLPAFLTGGPAAAPFPGYYITPQWLSDDFFSQQSITSPDVPLFQAFATTLRMLQNVFAAFDGSSEGEEILDILNRHNVTVNGQAMALGKFYKAAADALLGANTSTDSSITMPSNWDTLTAQDQSDLLEALIAALTPQTSKVLAPQGRFQDSSRLYTLRVFLRIKPETAGCPAELYWSCPSEPFSIASWYEGGGRPVPPIALPDPSNLRDLAKPNTSFHVPAGLMNAMQGSSLSGLMKGGGGGGGITIDWICGFNIPLITICAFFVLNIFFSLLAIIFFWLPFFKICIPIPVPKPSDGD